MVLPLIILAVPSIVSGFVNVPGGEQFREFMLSRTVEETLHVAHLPFNAALAGASSLVALGGIVLAWLVYGSRVIAPQALGSLLGGVPYRVLLHKYGLDFLYERVLVGLVLYTLAAGVSASFDRYVVEGVVNGTARITSGAGRGLRRVETGQLQAYGLAIFIGVVVITAAFLVRGT